jgi:hypothetical protein
LYRLGSISIEEVSVKIQIQKEKHHCSWYAFKTLCTQTKTILSGYYSRSNFFDKKELEFNLSNFFENEKYSSTWVLSLLEI